MVKSNLRFLIYKYQSYYKAVSAWVFHIVFQFLIILADRTARRNRCVKKIIFCAGSNGKCFYCLIRILRIGVKQSGTFCTKTRWVGAFSWLVPVITISFSNMCGGSNSKMWVRSIASFRCFTRSVYQLRSFSVSSL